MVNLGNTSVIVGTQWGDEGKGRVTDMLASSADVVARFSGGMNAGHTVIVGDDRFELHQIPSGILHREKKNIIGNGTVVHPESLVGEMVDLEARNLPLDNLFISDGAHVILPHHLLLDRLEEERKGNQKIGTTRKGIGPAYADKVNRRGIRMGDLLNPEIFRAKLENNLSYTNLLLAKIYNSEPMTTDAIIEEYRPFIERLRPHITNTVAMLNQALEDGKEILFEGAQGTLLDIDHGTYPFVTSSNPTAGGVCTGCGVGPIHIRKVVGVVKAYVTRVGAGPFPTEQKNSFGETLSTQGHEVGVTTGRHRRCGWFDAPMLRYSARINGLTHLVLTKLDVLSGFDTIPICTGYHYNDQVIEYPSNASILEHLTPIYEEMPGWSEDISDIRNVKDLPSQAQAYIQRIEQLTQVPVAVVSVGPGRDQAIVIDPTI